jgi:tubulin polyglutamylase TTLL4
MKPTNQACGRGIKMVTKDTEIRNKKDILVSEYIANPHLINNFKYDLRIYVLVTSYDPLRIYMFKEGLTRFATYEYNVKTKDVGKRFIHLTNFSVNKHSKKFVKNTKEEKDGEGSKWSLTALRKHYESIGINS